MRDSSRPFGVVLIAFVTLVTALMGLVALARVQAPESRPVEQLDEMRRQAHLSGAWAAVGLMAAAGLFGMRRWGWWLGLVYYAGTVLILALGRPGGSLRVVAFQVGLSVLVVWYLLSRDVRRAFLRR